MIRDPQPPAIGIVSAEKQAEIARLQARVEAAFTLSEASGMSIGEAIVYLDRPAASGSSGAPATGPATMTMDALCDDSEAMHDVVMAIMTEKRLSYMEGLAFLLDRHEEVAGGVSADERDTITLAAVLNGSGVSPARVMTLVAEQEQVRTLAAPSKGTVKRAIDDWGEVLRPLGTDLDELLADPLAPARDFRTARDAGLVADDGVAVPEESEEWDSWLDAWRSSVNRGRDLLATLQLREDERQAELAAQRQVAAIEQKVQSERRDQAQRLRQLAGGLEDDAKRLERL